MRPGNNQRCSGATPVSCLVDRAFHHCRNRSRISAGSITCRSLRPFDCTMRMIICSLSMSHARSRTTSLARNPQPYASVSIARALRLVAMVRTRLTSSGLNRRQLLRLLDVPDLGRQIVATQRDAKQEAHPGHDPIAVADARAALDEVQLEAADFVGGRGIGRAFEPGGEPLA